MLQNYRGDFEVSLYNLVVFQIDGWTDGVEQDTIRTPAKLITQWVVWALWSRKTTTKRAVRLHLSRNSEVTTRAPCDLPKCSERTPYSTVKWKWTFKKLWMVAEVCQYVFQTCWWAHQWCDSMSFYRKYPSTHPTVLNKHGCMHAIPTVQPSALAWSMHSMANMWSMPGSRPISLTMVMPASSALGKQQPIMVKPHAYINELNQWQFKIQQGQTKDTSSSVPRNRIIVICCYSCMDS